MREKIPFNVWKKENNERKKTLKWYTNATLYLVNYEWFWFWFFWFYVNDYNNLRLETKQVHRKEYIFKYHYKRMHI